MSIRSRLLIAVCALSLGAIAPAAAQAATLSIATGSGGQPVVRLSASAGETNLVTIGKNATDYLIQDLGVGMIVAAGCTSVDTNDATCPLASANSVQVLTNDLDDTITINGAIVSQIDAAAGNDTITGGTLADNIDGGTGIDTIDGGAGDDFIDGGTGADDMIGGAGNDWITYSSRATAVTMTMDDVANDGESGEGDNVHTDIENAFGGNEVDNFTGSSKANVFWGNGGNDVFDGGAGDDYFDGGSGNDDFTGGPGTDEVNYALWGVFGTGNVDVSIDDVADDGAPGETDNVRTSVEDITGSPGDDTITGSSSANRLDGGGGNDTIQGLGGADLLLGETGNDVLDGGTGADTLLGGGDDDILNGDTGNDTLDGGTGADVFNGGDDQDTADYRTRSQDVTVTLDGTADDGEATEGDNVQGDVENVLGGEGSDTLTGSPLANLLDGGPGDDLLTGGDGADTLIGGDGIDDLQSRDAFADALTCGDAADSVTADRSDTIATDCESVDLPALPPPPADPPAPPQAAPDPAPAAVPTPEPKTVVSVLPAITITIREVTAAISPATGIALVPIPITCPATETAGCAGRVTLSLPAPAKKSSRALASRRGRRPTLRLATRKFSVPAGRTIAVKVPLSKAVVSRLRKPAKAGGARRATAKLTLAASQRGTDGVVRTMKRRVTLRLG
jgi:Ca2+-binding RTX toxin-like protein